jgi:hypothetical protein
MQSQPKVDPVTMYAQQRSPTQIITNAIWGLKSTIHDHRKDDQATTLKKMEKYEKIKKSLTKEQKQAIENMGYSFSKKKGNIMLSNEFVDTTMPPAPQPKTESGDLYIPAGIGQTSMTVTEAAALRKKQDELKIKAIEEAAVLKKKQEGINEGLSSWRDKMTKIGSSKKDEPSAEPTPFEPYQQQTPSAPAAAKSSIELTDMTGSKGSSTLPQTISIKQGEEIPFTPSPLFKPSGV